MLFAGRFILLCTIVLATTGASTLTQHDLLAKMRTINGGLYNMHIVSTSEHVIDGVTAQAVTEASGLRFVVRECSGELCIGNYFDGSRLFQFNFNGTLLPPRDQPVRYLRALRILAMLSFLDPQFGAGGGDITDGGAAAFDGVRCRRLLVSSPGAEPFAAYIDPRTALVAGAKGLEEDWTIRFSDYRHVAAFALPFAIDYNGAPLERYSSRTIVAAPLNAPHGLTPSFHATPTPGMALDPTSVSPLGTCKIAGVEARCLIDTGNSGLSMSLQLVEKLNLHPIGMLPIAGLGSYSTEVVRAGPLEIGNADFGDANYFVLSDAERYGYDLVVGADVLADTPVTIDYQRHLLTFGDSDPVSQSNMLPVHFEKFIPVVNVTLDGKPAQLAVDTGDESNINLAYAYYLKHSDLFSITSTAPVGGVGGLSVEDLGELPEIRLGGITAQNQPIGTTRTLQGTADGHLGAAFLSKFKAIVLDYPREQLYLAPL